MAVPAKTFYLNPDAGVDITCDQCGRIRHVKAAVFEARQKHTARVRCPCGHAFAVVIERRRAARVRTKLHGDYVKIVAQPPAHATPKQGRSLPTVELLTISGQMIIEDLSFFGVRFRLDTPKSLQVGDLVRLEFVLDDPSSSQIFKIDDHSRTRVVKYVRVRWVDGQRGGAAFCDPGAFATVLEAYLKEQQARQEDEE